MSDDSNLGLKERVFDAEQYTEQELYQKIRESVPKFMEGEDRQDEEFRALIVEDQVGDLCRHITHDPDLNPRTRPLDEPEEVAFGDAFYQLLCLAHVRDIDIAKALEHGYRRNAVNREGYKQQSDEEMEGLVANAEAEEYTGVVGDDVFVVKEFSPDETVGIDEYDCALTEIGGMASHMATVAREHRINCVVGIQGLTGEVSDGDTVHVDLEEGAVHVQND